MSIPGSGFRRRGSPFRECPLCSGLEFGVFFHGVLTGPGEDKIGIPEAGRPQGLAGDSTGGLGTVSQAQAFKPET